MKKSLKVILPVFLVGFAFGNLFWFLASPLWITREVSESLPAEFLLKEIAKGEFNGIDDIHKGKGTVRLLKSGTGRVIVRFTDFSVINGPDLRVYLAKSADPQKASDILDGGFRSLGYLKGNVGDQTYTVPEDVDISEYHSVVIWCEPFRALFSRAPFK